MNTILMRAADVPAVSRPQRRIRGIGRRLGRLLSTLAHTAAERITSPYRDVPPEFYRFPPL